MIYEVITDDDISAACKAARVHVTPEGIKDMRRVLEGFVASRQAGLDVINKVSSSMAKGLLSQEAEISALKAANLKFEILCEETYVAKGADAYNHACSEMEAWQAKRCKAGKRIGTQGSLCDGMAWVYDRLSTSEDEIASLRVVVQGVVHYDNYRLLPDGVNYDQVVKTCRDALRSTVLPKESK